MSAVARRYRQLFLRAPAVVLHVRHSVQFLRYTMYSSGHYHTRREFLWRNYPRFFKYTPAATLPAARRTVSQDNGAFVTGYPAPACKREPAERSIE